MVNEIGRVPGLNVTDDSDVDRVTLTSGDTLRGNRIAPAAGLIVRDADGIERGGIGVLDLPDGPRMMSILDHRGGDGIGMTLSDDGSARLFINDAPNPDRTPQATRVKIEVGRDGTPGISLADATGQTRLRFGLTSEGAGAIEFLNADGDVVHRLVPEDRGSATGTGSRPVTVVTDDQH